MSVGVGGRQACGGKKDVCAAVTNTQPSSLSLFLVRLIAICVYVATANSRTLVWVEKNIFSVYGRHETESAQGQGQCFFLLHILLDSHFLRRRKKGLSCVCAVFILCVNSFFISRNLLLRRPSSQQVNTHIILLRLEFVMR